MCIQKLLKNVIIEKFLEKFLDERKTPSDWQSSPQHIKYVFMA